MRVAVVTGAGQGIGRRTAELLAARGYGVAMIDLKGSKATYDAIAGDALDFSGDVSDEATVAAFVEAVMARWGRVDVLVNNAGISFIAPAETVSAADFRKVLEVNLVAPFLLSKAFGAVMLQQGLGAIVHVASIAGLVGIGDRSPTTPASTGSSA